jgi:hypothetical protein
VPALTSIRSTLNRERGRHVPSLPQCRADVAVDGEWAETCDGRRFLIAGENSEMVIFSTDDNLRTLAACTTLQMDGTFKSCPSIYAQLYTIHGVVNNVTLPLVYALLPNKTRSTYNDLIQVVRHAAAELQLTISPTYVISDFECGLIDAVKQHFPQTRVIGCFFSLLPSSLATRSGTRFNM